MKSAIFHNHPRSDYEKSNWEFFWQAYNLIQFHEAYGVEQNQYNETAIASIETTLENFRVELHEIVKLLISKNIEINTDVDFDLLEDELIVAQAELGSATHKFFMYPFDEESRNKFIELGYKEFTIEIFDLSKI